VQLGWSSGEWGVLSGRVTGIHSCFDVCLGGVVAPYTTASGVVHLFLVRSADLSSYT
jgi:hypothetical protein